MTNISQDPIRTFVINLSKRVDRKTHSILQFENRPEFDVTFVEAEENIVGAVGLWNT